MLFFNLFGLTLHYGDKDESNSAACIQIRRKQMMIDLLTEQQGRVTFAARISNSPRAKVKKQYFQPFAVLDVEYDYRQKATIQTFIHVGIAYPLGSIPF